VDVLRWALLIIFLIVLFLAFRPEWRHALGGVQYLAIGRGDRLVSVRITSKDGGTNLIFEDVDWLDIIPFMQALTDPDHEQQGKSLRERVRFWHVATVLALVAAIAVLVTSGDEQNPAGAWGVVGAVVGVWIKPGNPGST
jgi:hypothetical protein